jgi:hypothetical protein
MREYVYIQISIVYKHMPQKQGDHLNVGEVKSSIIMFILQNVRSVGEPAIRDFLLQKYNVMNQGNINRHLHDLQKLDCIELIPPQKKGLRNYWDITKIKNLKKIRKEFPKLRLNKHEKAINIIILELCNDEEYFCFEWLKLHIQLLLSVSFFDTCLEIDIETLCQRIWKSYTTIKDIPKYKRINDLLKICYHTYTKHYSTFKVPEGMFINIMKKFPVEFVRIITKKDVIRFFKDLPGLPKEIYSQIAKTRLSEPIEEISEIPTEIDAEDFVKYMLHALQLIINQRWDFDSSIHYLLLEHFLIQDILIGVDLYDEHYFVKKTIENHDLFDRWPKPHYMSLGDAELADLKLISEIIIKYKQPTRFNDLFDNMDKVYQKLVKFYS